MIDKVANNERNTEELNLNSPEQVKEKLDYYRSLFNKVQDFSDDQLNALTQNIKTFFNLKSVGFTTTPPARLVRISSNNRILEAQGKKLGYLTDISQLLAPPIDFCKYGRCNIPNQQVLYCATTEAGAYWETRPSKGDVITLSHFELKPNTKINCNVVRHEKKEINGANHQLAIIAGLLDEFLIDAFSLEVSKDRPKDYLFSALLSSEQLFHPVTSEKNIQAMIYPSVQKKKFGHNFAIRNDLTFDKYDLIGVETRFILDEYANLDPSTENVTTDQIIGSFGTTAFDFGAGKILYNDKADELFKLLRAGQTSGKQTRIEYPTAPKNIAFNLTPENYSDKPTAAPTTINHGRNDRVNVVYQDGGRLDNVKYKKVMLDIQSGKCKITNF